ncbi:MAG: hypothetical protein U5J64_12720 [Halobacteriales archaeon]|nr:hypothetical protein [Halobacteriales archaeon]
MTRNTDYSTEAGQEQALSLFIIGYLVFVASSLYLLLGGIGAGMGEAGADPFSASNRSFFLLLTYSGILTMIVSQFWYLGIKPYLRNPNSAVSLIVYVVAGTAVLIVSLMTIEYLIVITYEILPPPESGIMYSAYSISGQVYINISVLVFVTGPIYALGFFVRLWLKNRSSGA